MDTTGLIILLVVALGIQVVLFITGRKLRKKQKENDVLEKYKISTRKDAWSVLADPELPEDDRKKLEALYNDENQ